MEAVRVFLLLPGTLACLSLVNVVTPGLLGAQPQKSKQFCISLSQFPEWKLDASYFTPR